METVEIIISCREINWEIKTGALRLATASVRQTFSFESQPSRTQTGRDISAATWEGSLREKEISL